MVVFWNAEQPINLAQFVDKFAVPKVSPSNFCVVITELYSGLYGSDELSLDVLGHVDAHIVNIFCKGDVEADCVVFVM